jgi:hypothetical protein
MPDPGPDLGPGPHSPYDQCALQCFDLGDHAGHGSLPPGCVCGAPKPPPPPPIYKDVSVTVARSSVQEWSGVRFDVNRCALIYQNGSATQPPAPPPPVPSSDPTGHLARGSFLRTATLGYDQYLAGGTAVALTPRPANVANQSGFTWVTVQGRTGFVANYDLTK